MITNIIEFIKWLDWPAIICCTPLFIATLKEGYWR